jgi:hypothetical protein
MATPLLRLAAALVVAGAVLLASKARAADECPQPDRPAYGHRVRFDASGALVDSCAAVVQKVLGAAPAASDIIIFSHGWKNDPVGAEGTYSRFISGMLARRPPELGERFKPLLVGIFWPSALFPISHDDEESLSRAQIDSRATLEAKIRMTFDWLGNIPDVDADIRDVARLVELEVQGKPRTRADFILLANILKRWSFFAGDTAASERGSVEAPGERPLFTLEPGALAQFLLDNSYAGGGQESFTSRAASVLSVLNTFTFWTMKRRAGEVGESGVYELVKRLRAANGNARIHLVGHSFGGKVVLAAAAGPLGQAPNVVDSIVVIQGALSHFSLSLEDDLRDLGIGTDDLKQGRYASITSARSVAGPVIVIFSKLDSANGSWYPLGARISGDALEKRERKPPIYGALGYNGALRVQAQMLKLRRGQVVTLDRPGAFTLYNVDATEVVPGHSKYFATEVYDLLWSILKVSGTPGAAPAR